MSAIYKKVIVKLSGEALSSGDGILSPEKVEDVAKTIEAIHSMGVGIGVVVGAGNIWRGRLASMLQIDPAEADYMGMLGTVINGLAIHSALTRHWIDCLATSAIPAPVAEPYSVETAKKALDEGKVVVLAGGTGKPFCTTDSGAAKRAIELGCDAILMGKFGVEGVFDSDPRKNPSAKLLKDLTFTEVKERGLTFMDLGATEMLLNKDIEVRVFAMDDLNNFVKVISGEKLGTTITKE